MDRRLLAIALLSPLLALAVIRSLGEIADACVLDRFSTAGREALLDQYAGLVLAPSAWLLVFVCNACLCVALLCTAPSTVVAAHRAMPRWINYVTVWRVAVAQATYLVAQFLTVALKSALADKTCHDRPNSVSGHAVFHIMHCFALGYIRVVQHRQFASAKVSATGAPRAEAPVAVLLLPLDAAGMCACANESRKQQQQHQQQAIDRSDASAAVTSPSPLHYSPLPPRLHSFLFSASFAFHVIMASGSMFHTYAFGFHSARQIFWGIALAASALAVLVHLLDTGDRHVAADATAGHKALGDSGLHLPVGTAFVLALASLAALTLAWAFAAHRLKLVEAGGAAVCIALAFLLTRVRFESTVTAPTR